jgi:hypothetical protein
MIDAGFEATPDSNPEEFRAVLAADVTLRTPVVKALGLKIDWGAEFRFTPLSYVPLA